MNTKTLANAQTAINDIERLLRQYVVIGHPNFEVPVHALLLRRWKEVITALTIGQDVQKEPTCPSCGRIRYCGKTCSNRTSSWSPE